jgi:hypothetical protein
MSAAKGAIGGALGLCFALHALPALAQTDPRLTAAVRLAQEGLGDSARTSVQRILDATQPNDTLYPQALYTRAIVASDPEEMRRDLQRVAVEYSFSDWAANALLRLAQLDYAGGGFEAAARNLERLRLDHPSSPLMSSAALWAGRSYFELRNPTAACGWLTAGLAEAGADLELKNQLEFYQQRCAVATAETTTTAQPSGRTADSSSRPVPSARDSSLRRDTTAHRPVFRIQLAAVAAQAVADDIARKAKAAGFAAVIAKEKGYLKVRVGSYPSRAAAAAALPGVRAKLGGQPFIVGD